MSIPRISIDILPVGRHARNPGSLQIVATVTVRALDRKQLGSWNDFNNRSIRQISLDVEDLPQSHNLRIQNLPTRLTAGSRHRAKPPMPRNRISVRIDDVPIWKKIHMLAAIPTRNPQRQGIPRLQTIGSSQRMNGRSHEFSLLSPGARYVSRALRCSDPTSNVAPCHHRLPTLTS